jgi:hypothetical protein
LLAVAALLGALPARAEPVYVGWHELVPVGDLDGDGVADLAVSTASVSPDENVVVHSGATGEPLWGRREVFVTRVVPARIGARREPALVLESIVERHPGVGVRDQRGALLWQRYWPRTYDSDLTVAAVLTGDFVPGAGDDVLVAFRAAGDDTETVGARFAEVLDGATGVTAAVLRPETTGRWAGPPAVAGDLDGDRATDVVWAESLGDGHDVVRAYTGTGRLLWENDDIAFVARQGVTPVGDVTGDGRPDLTVLSEERHPGWWETTLLSGADGRIAWTRPGTEVFRLGDVSGDRTPDLLVTENRHPHGDRAVFARSYDGTGRLLARHRLPYTNLRPAGDVTGDGVEDFHGVWWWSETDRRRPEGTVDGRTGRILRTNVAGEVPLRASVDCRGTDTTTVTYGATTAVVKARDGASGRTLWSVRVPVDQGDRNVGLTALPRLPGRCADVLVATSSGYTARITGTGRLRWSLGDPA